MTRVRTFADLHTPARRRWLRSLRRAPTRGDVILAVIIVCWIVSHNL